MVISDYIEVYTFALTELIFAEKGELLLGHQPRHPKEENVEMKPTILLKLIRCDIFGAVPKFPPNVGKQSVPRGSDMGICLIQGGEESWIRCKGKEDRFIVLLRRTCKEVLTFFEIPYSD